MRIYCDSSTTEACLVPEGQKLMIIPYKEKVTNNVGEYSAVIFAFEWAEQQLYYHKQPEETIVLTDSLLVVMQTNKGWKCRHEHLLPFRDRVIWFLNKGYKLSWTPREENLAGKELEKRVRK